MAEVSLKDLRDAVIFRADLPVSEPRRYSDAQIDLLINQSIRRFQGNLITWWGDDYFTRYESVSVSAGAQRNIDLAGDIKIKNLIWIPGNATQNGRVQAIKLHRLDLAQFHRNVFPNALKWSISDPPKWHVTYNPAAATNAEISPMYKIEFTPETAEDENLQLIHVSELPKLVDDADEFPTEFGWEDWIVLDVMVRIRIRDKQEASDVVRERAELAEAIREQAPEKAQSDIRTVRDIYPTDRSGAFDPRLFPDF
ncbi:MAG: hypothetical protein O7B23_10785 [Deltaproteobacteria bacterium]|nr:hypothetical protein [Deltaproteobacteria bacterium]